MKLSLLLLVVVAGALSPSVARADQAPDLPEQTAYRQEPPVQPVPAPAPNPPEQPAPTLVPLPLPTLPGIATLTPPKTKKPH